MRDTFTTCNIGSLVTLGPVRAAAHDWSRARAAPPAPEPLPLRVFTRRPPATIGARVPRAMTTTTPVAQARPAPTRVTRSQRVIKSVRRLNLIASVLSPIPNNYRFALSDPNWRQATQDEFDALLTNSTRSLVPKPAHANIVIGKWIFKHKFHANGSLARYKACWVV